MKRQTPSAPQLVHARWHRLQPDATNCSGGYFLCLGYFSTAAPDRHTSANSANSGPACATSRCVPPRVPEFPQGISQPEDLAVVRVSEDDWTRGDSRGLPFPYPPPEGHQVAHASACGSSEARRLPASVPIHGNTVEVIREQIPEPVGSRRLPIRNFCAGNAESPRPAPPRRTAPCSRPASSYPPAHSESGGG